MPVYLSTMFRTRGALICALLILCLPLASLAADPPRYVGLTILHTNDIHGHLFAFDYDILGKQETQVGGAARRAALIRQMRDAASNPVLVMDAGDVFIRGPLSDLRGEPDFAVMNAVPYDIMTLGNNEFKGAANLEGLRLMMERVKQARFPVVSANVFDKATGKTIVPPYKVIERGGLRIGVLGLTAQRVAGYPEARGLEIRDPIVTAKKMLPELEKQCDLVVALTHIGYESDLELAAAVPEIDVIIGGDSHTWLAKPTLLEAALESRPDWWVGGTVICQDGEWGKTVGRLDLSLRLANDGRYRVMGYSGELVNVDSSIKPAGDVERILWHYAKPFYREVGTLEKAVPKPEAAGWVAERLREAAGVEIAAEPKSAVENGLPAGRVTYLDIRLMFPFVNGVVKLRANAKQIREFVVQTDAATAGARVADGALYVDDSKVDDGTEFTVAIEDFYASTSPAFAGCAPEAVGKTTRDIVTDYLGERR